MRHRADAAARRTIRPGLGLRRGGRLLPDLPPPPEFFEPGGVVRDVRRPGPPRGFRTDHRPDPPVDRGQAGPTPAGQPPPAGAVESPLQDLPGLRHGFAVRRGAIPREGRPRSADRSVVAAPVAGGPRRRPREGRNGTLPWEGRSHRLRRRGGEGGSMTMATAERSPCLRGGLPWRDGSYARRTNRMRPVVALFDASRRTRTGIAVRRTRPGLIGGDVGLASFFLEQRRHSL
mmetsp:Transcript_9416/g.23102  ORF Transcript_9416/g.23102 Transcript_9416/m.23102 type:complete len:232 (-) Transcript_9416:58-753(-)